MTKKIFAMFLAVLMVVSMLPTSVFAATCPGANAVHTKNNCDWTQVGEPVAPTCGAQGYTNYKCNECGKNFIADQVPAAGEHTWVAAKDEAETCLENGKTGGKECSVCHTKVEQTVVNNIPDGFTCDWEDMTPSIDCMTGGTKQYKCKVCGDTKEGEKIEANTPHKWAEDGGNGWKLVAGKTDLAERKCLNCGKVENCVVYASHEHVYVKVEAVAPKCDVAGVAEHFVCRICEQMFVYGKASATATEDTYNLVTEADLRVATLHETILSGLTCMTTTYPCPVCEKVLKVEKAAAHKFSEWEELTPATCTTDGFQKRECTVEGCPNIETAIIPALGHIEREWTVEATCVQYEYTFTYCLRAGCVDPETATTVKIGNTDVVFDLTEGYSALETPVVGAGFVLNMTKGGKVLYFVGTASSDANEYLNTSENVANAVVVYVEVAKDAAGKEIDGGYWMYFIDAEDNKQYISIYTTAANKQRVGIFAEPQNYWTWNEDYKILTTKLGDTEYWVGSYENSNYSTMQASKLSYLAEEGQCPTKMTVSNANGVALLDIDVNVEGGFNAENHANAKKVTTLVPNCQEGVTNTWLCYSCSVSWNKEEAKVDHNWIADTSKDCAEDCDKAHEHVVNGVQNANCTDKGAKYFVCGFGCGETKVEEEAAKGHSAIYEYINGVKTDKVFTVVGTHTSVTVYDYKECYYCHAQIEKTNYRVWEGVGKLWNTMEDAAAAHNGKLADEAEVEVDGDCTKVGYKGYKCSECGEVVRVKTATTGAHVYSANQHKDPTCTEPGWDYNERCQRCDQKKDKTLEEGYKTVLPVIAHDWYTPTKDERLALGWTEVYVAAPCDQPNYVNYVAYCKVCDALKNDGTELLNTITVSTPASLCGEMTYEWYTCHCGENHIRNFVGKISHVYEAATDADLEALAEVEGFDGKLKVDATCTAAGYVWKKCSFCGEFEKETIAQKPHQNKAEEEFVDSCVSKVTDRHCVLCCKCADKKDHDCTADQEKDVEGLQTCKCVIPAVEHNWDRVNTFVPAHCDALPYSMRVCLDCGKQEIVNYPGYWDGVTKNEKGEIVLNPIVGLNHTPVAYTNGDKYANLKYLPAEQYIYSLNEDGILVLDVVSYTGIYQAYTAPTYTSAGSATFVCSQCNELVTVEIPAISGLGFELEVKNANGADEITYGSLVEVIVYANANGTAVHNFNFTVNYDNSKLVFIEADRLKDSEFNTITTDATLADATKYLGISGTAVNNAEGKKQNVNVGEKTVLTKLYFRYVDAVIAEDEAPSAITLGNVFAFELNSQTPISCTAKGAEVAARTFLDFNGDNDVWFTDVYMADAMLNGEYKYDVTIDVDKDGEITLTDLFYIYDVCLKNVAIEELLFVGIEDEAEVAILKAALTATETHAHTCVNCDYGSDYYFFICPKCFTAQPAQN